MVQVITATAEPDFGRVKLVASGGTTGDAFYVVRQDSQGSNLIRDTTGDGVTWQADPAATLKNLFKNPAFKTTAGYTTCRTNYALNPNFALPTSNIAAQWSAYSSGTVTGTRTNDGTNGQYIRTTSINAGAKYGIVSTSQSFTATTRRVLVAMDAINGTVEGVASLNTCAAKMQVEFRLSTTVVATQTVTLANWSAVTSTAYTGGSSIDNVVVTFYLENTTGSTITATQTLRPLQMLIEVTDRANTPFSGYSDPADDGWLTYAWTGTVNASTSIARRPAMSLCPSYSSSLVYQTSISNNTKLAIEANGASNQSYTTLDGGSGALRLGFVQGQTYTIIAQCTIPQVTTGAQNTLARRIAVVTKIGANPSVTVSSSAAPNVVGTYDVSLTFTVPAGATEAYAFLYNGSPTEGEIVIWDNVVVVAGTYTGGYFDGNSANASWDGTPDNSTSTQINAALSITMYDYEARQGFTATYAITNDVGIPGAYSAVDIPNWGTWLKDPFRPFMNCRVLWNADSEYIREARREKLWARGAKFPVFHSDKRSAPRGSIVVATETTVDATKLTSMLDGAETIMIDVDSRFGVPVRYVSVGDVTGARAGQADSALSWEARLWTLQIDEVAMPIGAPITQNRSYDQIAAQYGSYIAIPASVPSYDALAAGS